MGFRTHYPQNAAPWQVEDFKRKEFEKITEKERLLWPSPEADHKIVLWEAPSLYPEERSIIIYKDEGDWEES